MMLTVKMRQLAEIIGFATRRLGAEAIAILLSCREDETPLPFPAICLPCSWIVLARQQSREDWIVCCRPSLVAGTEASSGVWRQPRSWWRWRPSCRADQLAGREHVDELDCLRAGPGTPARPGRSDTVTVQAYTAAVLVAVAAEDELAVVLAAARCHGLSEQAFQDLEDRGVISLRPRIQSVPAMFHNEGCGSSRKPRQGSCARLTGQLASADGSDAQERRAWHLAAAALEPDEEIASLLESTAESARAGKCADAAAASGVCACCGGKMQHEERQPVTAPVRRGECRDGWPERQLAVYLSKSVQRVTLRFAGWWQPAGGAWSFAPESVQLRWQCLPRRRR